jgi:alkylation response protein AidB-like acyl-CoA dehydrogenase
MHVPASLGGSGGSFADVATVAGEMGAVLLCAPFLSTVVLAATALLRSGDDEAAARYLPGMVAGTTTATLAFGGGRAGGDGDAVGPVARRSGSGFVLDGPCPYVLDGHTADLVLVLARGPAGAGLFAVPPGAPGMTRTPLVTLDQTRRQARVDLAGTPAEAIRTGGTALAVLEEVLDLAAVALAAEQVGGARRCLDMAVAHAKARVQFGRPIGSFQAVKHKLADVLVAVDSARSVAAAARAAADGAEDLPLLASTAKAHCSEAYVHAAAESIQVHGGVGFTWDHDAHLYFKRARSSALLFGDPAWHRERVARLLGL